MGCRTRNGGFGEFCGSNPEGSIFFIFFSKFLSLVSFFYFSVRLRVKVRVSFRVRFCLSDVLRWAKISLAHSLDPGVNI